MKTILLCAAFLMLTTTAHAKAVSCTISTIKDQVITLECTGKTVHLKVGQKVSIKELKKKKTKEIEGC